MKFVGPVTSVIAGFRCISHRTYGNIQVNNRSKSKESIYGQGGIKPNDSDEIRQKHLQNPLAKPLCNTMTTVSATAATAGTAIMITVKQLGC